MKSFEVPENKYSLNSEIRKEYRFKIHQQAGPGFHTDFTFLIKSNSSQDERKKIEFEAKRNVTRAFGGGECIMTELFFERMVVEPFGKGIQLFIDHLDEQEFGISTDLKVELCEYVFHSIDSKPIGNELGLAIALRSVFKERLNTEIKASYIFEELE